MDAGSPWISRSLIGLVGMGNIGYLFVSVETLWDVKSRLQMKYLLYRFEMRRDVDETDIRHWAFCPIVECSKVL